MEWLRRLPPWMVGTAGVGGTLVTGFSAAAPPELQAVGFWAGLILVGIAVFAAVLHFVPKGRSVTPALAVAIVGAMLLVGGVASHFVGAFQSDVPKWLEIDDAITRFGDPVLLARRNAAAAQIADLLQQERAVSPRLAPGMVKLPGRQNDPEPELTEDQHAARTEFNRIRAERGPPEQERDRVQTALLNDIRKKLADGALVAKGFPREETTEVRIPQEQWRLLELRPNGLARDGSGLSYRATQFGRPRKSRLQENKHD